MFPSVVSETMNGLEPHETANSIVKLISVFAVEFEGAKARPNVIFLSSYSLECLKLYYPYMVIEDTVAYNKDIYKVILTEEDTVGLAMAFYLDPVVEYIDEP